MQALVIDDSRAVRLLVGNILREQGFQVFDAGHGQEGLEKLRDNPGDQSRARRLEHAGDGWPGVHSGGSADASLGFREDCHGDDRNRKRTGATGDDGGRKRVRDEAIYRGSARRQVVAAGCI